MRFYRERRLEDLCLNTIVANLGNFYLHYELGDRYNNFLKKRYSERIYNLLKKNGILEEKLTNWLISPYWNNVIVEKTHPVSNLIPKFINYGKQITSVSFENSSATVEILSAVVCLLPRVKSLNLNGTSCTDDLLTLVRKVCPELNSLSLFECEVSDRGIKNLCYVNREKVNFNSLKELNIVKTKVTKNGIIYIFKNLNLCVIKYPDIATILYYYHLTEVKKSAGIAKTYELKELEYSSNKFLSTVSFKNILQAWVVLCPKVEKLSVVDWLSECDFELCLKFQNLKSLTFTELPYLGNPSKEGLAYFLEMRGEKLTELVFQNVSISVEVVGKVCLNLQKLTLSNINYQEFNESLVSDKVHHLNSLVKLSIKNSCMYERATNNSIHLLLRISKNIESVSFHCVRNLSDELVDNLIDMQHLFKAKFVFTDIKDSAAMKLFTCKSIRKLYFDGCPYVPVEKCADVFCSHCRENTGNTFSWRIEYDERIT